MNSIAFQVGTWTFESWDQNVVSWYIRLDDVGIILKKIGPNPSNNPRQQRSLGLLLSNSQCRSWNQYPHLLLLVSLYPLRPAEHSQAEDLLRCHSSWDTLVNKAQALAGFAPLASLNNYIEFCTQEVFRICRGWTSPGNSNTRMKPCCGVSLDSDKTRRNSKKLL